MTVDRHNLYYSNGSHKLVLSVEWSGVAKTEDSPIDFEIRFPDPAFWTEPAGEPILPERREALLDEIAAYYSKSPAADIVGENSELLRGVSKFRFSLQIPPEPSRYDEVGRFLAVPMVTPAKGAKAWHERYVADLRRITEWTRPRVPLDAAYLNVIGDRIERSQKIGVKRPL